MMSFGSASWRSAQPWPQLQLLGFLRRRAQRHRDVVGHLVAGDRDHRRVPDRAAREHREIGRAAADVHEADARAPSSSSFSTAIDEASGCRITSFTTSPQRRTHLVMFSTADTAPGDDVHLDLEAHAAHAERLAHVLLPVDDEFLRQDVQDLLVVRDRDRLRRLDDAVDVGLR